MSQRETPQVIGVRHVGLSARDPAALVEFYREVLGLQVVPSSGSGPPSDDAAGPKLGRPCGCASRA